MRWAQTSVEPLRAAIAADSARPERLRINPDIPADQRALLDYGGYFTFNFFSIDDIQQKTHILRQYDLVAYARLNIDNVHEFFCAPAPPIAISTTTTASTAKAMRRSDQRWNRPITASTQARYLGL